jgi:hypothetical protein
MGSFKEKSQGFIIGIMVGLIVAGGFFILKLDDYFKELNFYKSVTNTFSTESKTEEPKAEEAEKPVQKKKEKPAPEAVDESKEVETAPVTDISITHDSAVVETGADDIVIRKDELLSTKTLEVMNLDPVAKISAKDSLLQKVSGIKDDRSFKQYMNIEFWSSPLNYKGYKMNKYKLVVYGIPSAEGLKLFKLDDVIYVKLASFVYRLDTSVDFKPYERITDEEILNKLK